MSERGFDYSKRRYIPISPKAAEDLAVKEGDLYVSRGNGSLHLLGRSTLAQEPPGRIVFPDTMIRLRFGGGRTLVKYIHYLWESWVVRSQIEAKARTTAGIYKISQPDVRAFVLPVAPSDEQRRIVAKIEELFSELDAGVAALERVRAGLKRYRAAVLKAAVEGKLTEDWRAQHPDTEPASETLRYVAKPERPARYSSRSIDVTPGHAALSVGATGAKLPRGWAWAPLVDVARMESGHTPSRNHPEWWHGDVRWIGILDAKAHHGRTIYETLQHTNTEGLANSAARLLPSGTVCVSRTAASIGYVTLLGNPMATSQDFINWVPYKAILPEWLRLVFMVDRQVLIRFGKGSTHKTVYYPEWLSMHVAIPPLSEQAIIAAEVERRLSIVDEVEAQVEANLKRAARLRQGILKRAFEGKLIPQDPSDEPADQLLARIRAEGRDGTPRPKAKRERRGPRADR